MNRYYFFCYDAKTYARLPGFKLLRAETCWNARDDFRRRFPHLGFYQVTARHGRQSWDVTRSVCEVSSL